MHVKLQIVEFEFKLYLRLMRIDYVKTVDDLQWFILCGGGTHASYIFFILIELSSG
jgi:hypothetical protein